MRNPASADTLETTAQYRAADRQSMLEAGARAEGALSVYSSNVQGDSLIADFSKKYPYIKLELFRGDGPVLVNKVFEETSAGRPNADVVETATGGFLPLIDAEMLQPYYSPELANFPKSAINKDGYYAFNYESFVSLGFNTALVPEDEAPRTLDELLDPKWHGKMAFPGTSTLANWIGATLIDKGEGFLRKLGQQDIRVYEISGRALANLVVSGEAPLSPAVFSAHMANSKSQGASVAWRPLGGVYSNVSGVTLLKSARHPHAAMLYIDFIYSRETQKSYQALGYASARTDLVNPEPPKKFYYLSEMPNYMSNYQKWTALAQQIFGKAKARPDNK